jgi:E-phenylitaconyl-CoA hydratase
MVETKPLIRVDVDDKIATITIDRPEKKNAVNNAASRQLYAAFERVRDDDDVWIAILTGAGDSFSSGRDLVERADVGDLPGPTNAKIYELMRGVFKPTIAVSPSRWTSGSPRRAHGSCGRTQSAASRR